MDTHITFVLDSSGSMDVIADDTRGGFNTFLKDQRDQEGTATVTLYDFNTTVDQIYETYPVADAPELTDENYKPPRANSVARRHRSGSRRNRRRNCYSRPSRTT